MKASCVACEKETTHTIVHEYKTHANPRTVHGGRMMQDTMRSCEILRSEKVLK